MNKTLTALKLAEEACAPNQTFNSDEEWVKRFAALVAAHEKKFWMEQIEVECNEAVLAEREACAKVCEEVGPKEGSLKLITESFAAAIRARSEK